MFYQWRAICPKPCVASGARLKRMRNYCSGRSYKTKTCVDDNACRMAASHWNFPDPHEAIFANNPRKALMAKNLQQTQLRARTGEMQAPQNSPQTSSQP